ncbi:MAG: hypothetical protein ACKVRO_06260 [Micropepsaceae bacterium]
MSERWQTCPFCKTSLSIDAIVCKGCGATRRLGLGRKGRRLVALLLFLVVAPLVLLFFGSWMVAGIVGIAASALALPLDRVVSRPGWFKQSIGSPPEKVRPL